MLDSIKDWFVDRLHKYMDAAREIVENNEGIRSAETYYRTCLLYTSDAADEH